MKTKKHKLIWFKNRIGKTIYRDGASGACKTCTDITHQGLTIKDVEHAKYVHMVSHDLDIDYRDKR